MPTKRQLGSILLESGRITQSEVDRSLDYQRTHGGFFGQAVVALGIMSREEIDWALASQFDLPFIFPNPSAVDREAARLVPADWALAHLAVPIVRAGSTLTVVVADPLDGATLNELHERTGLEVEMALASASRIRELIRTIYGDATPSRAEDVGPETASVFLAHALEAGASRIGISVRGPNAQGWYATPHGRERVPLTDGWAAVLEDVLDPSPFDVATPARGGVISYEGTLIRAGASTIVDVQVSASEAGAEILLQPRTGNPAARAVTVTLPPSVAAELRLIARSAHARVALAGGDEDLRNVLPQLPVLVFGADVRAAHVTDDADLPGIFTLRPEGDEFAAALQAYDFDAVTVDLSIAEPELASIMNAAPISFVHIAGTPDRSALVQAGINWLLSATHDRGSLVWELRPMAR